MKLASAVFSEIIHEESAAIRMAIHGANDRQAEKTLQRTGRHPPCYLNQGRESIELLGIAGKEGSVIAFSVLTSTSWLNQHTE